MASDVNQNSQYVYAEEAVTLTVRLRVAWAAEAVERVLALFSPYPRHTYLQGQALDLAWAYAIEEREDLAETEEIIEQINSMIKSDVDQSYGLPFLAMGLLVAEEIVSQDGRGVSRAVDYAASAFAAFPLFAQGVSPVDQSVPYEYKLQLGRQFWRFARDLFDRITRCVDRRLSRDIFSDVQLDLSFPTLNPEVLRACTVDPPAQEVEYCKNLVAKM